MLSSGQLGPGPGPAGSMFATYQMKQNLDFLEC